LRLFASFVNGKRPVSTGFLRFFSVFMLFFWNLYAFVSFWEGPQALEQRGSRTLSQKQDVA